MNIIFSSKCIRLSRLGLEKNIYKLSQLGIHSSSVLAKKVNIIKGRLESINI